MSTQHQVVPSRTAASRTANPNRCSYTTSDHRRCTMLRNDSHSSLCPFHARKERLLLESQRVGSELSTISGEFRTTTDINHVLGKLWDMLAQDRIPRKRAATMAYIAALILPTVERVRLETSDAIGHDAWTRTLRRAFPRPNPLQQSSTNEK